MENKIVVLEPSFIYDLFDSIIAKTDFFKLPRFEAFLHSFRILEAMQYNISLGNKALDELVASSRFFEDSKKYLIYWIYSKCPEGGRFIKTNESHIEKSMPALSLAYKFSHIHDAIVATQKNWATFYFDEQKKLINFKYQDQKKGVLLFRNFFDRVIRETENIRELTQDMKNAKAMIEAFNQFSEMVRITTDKKLRYSTNKFILNSFEKHVKETLSKQTILHDSWSLGPYSIGDFRSTWIQINKLSIMHMFAYIRSIQKFGNYDPGFNNSIFKVRKSALIKYLNKHTGLSEIVISEIIRDLTYDYTIPHMDIMYQPLIEMNNEIFISPHLIIGSFIDRNFQVLITKLPHRKNEYDRLKNLKEGKMIEELTPQLQKYGFKFKSKIILKENKKIKTDIDLLIWDETYEDFLLIQLKWFYGPDSTQELFNHDVQFNEGIYKTKICIEYLEENIEKVFSILNISQTKGRKSVYGIILSKLGTPSPFIEDPNFPVIEEIDFFELLKNSEGSISNLYNAIISFFESKKRVNDLKESSSELNIGDYTFVLPAIEY